MKTFKIEIEEKYNYGRVFLFNRSLFSGLKYCTNNADIRKNNKTFNISLKKPLLGQANINVRFISSYAILTTNYYENNFFLTKQYLITPEFKFSDVNNLPDNISFLKSYFEKIAMEINKKKVLK